jgi:hypothetical protein
VGRGPAPADHGAGVDLLPPMKPFPQHRDEIVVRAVDPDTWRIAGWPETPITSWTSACRVQQVSVQELPRDYDAAAEVRRAIERSSRGASASSTAICAAVRGFAVRGLRGDRRDSLFRHGVALHP